MQPTDRIRAFFSLCPNDQFRLITASCLLIVIWAGVFVVSFQRFRLVLVKIGILSESIMPGSPTPERVAKTVDTADRHLPGERTCLVRSLSTEVLLTSYNCAFTHRIGVDRTSGGQVHAHSWIEYNGKILIGQLEDMSGFEPLPPLAQQKQAE